jgi:quercetin dioxygenase-like cupin family protein
MIRETMKLVNKTWGKEIILVNRNYCGKFLYLDRGATISLHAHQTKCETMYGLQGSARLVIEEEEHLLTPFNLPKTIFPNEFHTLYGLSDAVILEISTYEDDKVVRRTRSQPGEKYKPNPDLRVISVDRDGVLLWGDPPGIVSTEDLRSLRAKGYIVGTGGGAPGEEQRAEWLAHGIEPDFALSKGELLSLRERYPNGDFIHVDNEPVVVHGFKTIMPSQVRELL